jgi:hypothetical protein
VAADDAIRIDDALVDGAYEAANEREVLRARQASRQRGRGFQISHQNRRLATVGMFDDQGLAFVFGFGSDLVRRAGLQDAEPFTLDFKSRS